MSPKTPVDTLYAEPINGLGQFTFNAAVADVFPDMINRSVPGYGTIVKMTGIFAERFAQKNTSCYDLGCSLGASSLAMAKQLQGKQCRIIGIDNSSAMIERCATINHGYENIEFLTEDILNINFEPASVVVLNFTLQFIPLAKRLTLMENIYQCLQPGGALIISEKILFEDEHLNAINVEMHENFKRLNGYSELEIAQKRSALEDVLICESIETHKNRLLNCGFASTDVWFQCFNFTSMLALK